MSRHFPPGITGHEPEINGDEESMMATETIRVMCACGHEDEAEPGFEEVYREGKCSKCLREAQEAFLAPLLVAAVMECVVNGKPVTVARTGEPSGTWYAFGGEYRPAVGEQIDWSRAGHPPYGRTPDEAARQLDSRFDGPAEP